MSDRVPTTSPVKTELPERLQTRLGEFGNPRGRQKIDRIPDASVLENPIQAGQHRHHDRANEAAEGPRRIGMHLDRDARAVGILPTSRIRTTRPTVRIGSGCSDFGRIGTGSCLG